MAQWNHTVTAFGSVIPGAQPWWMWMVEVFYRGLVVDTLPSNAGRGRQVRNLDVAFDKRNDLRIQIKFSHRAILTSRISNGSAGLQ
jgi:hypothetical protein